MVLADLLWQLPSNCPISWRNSGRSIELFKRNAGNYYERKSQCHDSCFRFYGDSYRHRCLKVLETGMLPVINTAIAHKEPGIGMIGAGLTNPPANVFNEALKALVATIN